MYSVFGDESADETKARVFAVSGIFGSELEWEELKSAWLDRMGGRIFHATDCDTDQGDFADSGHAANKALYKDLTQLLCKSRLMGRSHVIDLAGWKTHFPDALEDIPYLTCFRNVVHDCGRLAFLSVPRDTVEFTFDQRQETNYNAGVLYSYMAQVKEWKASAYLQDKVSFATRKYVGIQAADLLARKAMKHLDNIVGSVRRRTRLSMSAILNTSRFRFNFLMREWFEAFKENLNQISRQSGVDFDDFRQWLDRNGLIHNISNLHRYMIEKWPPDAAQTAIEWRA